MSHKGGVWIPSGKRLELFWIRGSMTVTTWTEEADAMSNRAASLKRQRRRTCGAQTAEYGDVQTKSLFFIDEFNQGVTKVKSKASNNCLLSCKKKLCPLRFNH